MTLEEFYEELSHVSATRKNRLQCAEMVLKDMSLFPKLIDIMFRVDDPTSSRAAWVFEFVCEEYIYAIIPYLDIFTSNLKSVHLDSSVRPMSKVCTFIANTYFSEQPNTLKKMLKPHHKERIIEASFDWLIKDEKVAPKAYAMETLYLFGKEYSWINPELAQILEQDYATQSAAYKARAKHILKKIKKQLG
ncbi:adenylosuccinate lyase [Mariniflexile aquimaris]|uniref:Adenylosuccinate lyase n=1 Tax=Mariniflexile aquimaris TaxID=881009 RepID=A0ABW3BVB8_9FLAO